MVYCKQITQNDQNSSIKLRLYKSISFQKWMGNTACMFVRVHIIASLLNLNRAFSFLAILLFSSCWATWSTWWWPIPLLSPYKSSRKKMQTLIEVNLWRHKMPELNKLWFVCLRSFQTYILRIWWRNRLFEARVFSWNHLNQRTYIIKCI